MEIKGTFSAQYLDTGYICHQNPSEAFEWYLCLIALCLDAVPKCHSGTLSQGTITLCPNIYI